VLARATVDLESDGNKAKQEQGDPLSGICAEIVQLNDRKLTTTIQSDLQVVGGNLESGEALIRGERSRKKGK